MANNSSTYKPPPGPPSLLNPEQIRHLASQGWLEIALPDHLDDALGRLASAASTFFACDYEVKQNDYPSTRGTECGFYSVTSEKEYLTLRREVYRSCELEQQAGHVWRDTGHFLYRILCDLAGACGLDAHVWDHLVEGSLDLPRADCNLDNVTTLMRLFHYHPTTGIAEQHVDIGLLTLCISNSDGLQVMGRAAQAPEWIKARRTTVLIGETARSLLQNRVRAGLHRVVGNTNGRDSIVFALRPYLGSTTDLSRFGGEGIVDTRRYYNGIRDRRYNVNAMKDIREQQRKTIEEQNKLELDPNGTVPGLG